MDTKTVVKQVAISLFARRKKWIVITTIAALLLLLPAAYILSKEPPRYRTTATILIESKVERSPVFQEFSPYRPLPVQLAILQSRLLAASVIEALPKAAVDDLIHNPYGRDYVGEFMDLVRSTSRQGTDRFNAPAAGCRRASARPGAIRNSSRGQHGNRRDPGGGF